MKRRDFLKLAGAASAAGVARGAKPAPARGIAIVIDPRDPVAGANPVRWAAEQLRSAIAEKGVLCRIADSVDQVRGATLYVIVNAMAVTPGKSAQKANAKPAGAEHFQLAPGRWGATPIVLVLGGDVRAYVYGLLELAERVQYGSAPALSLHLTGTIDEKPANEIRSVGRYFCSELEDKPWLYDRDFWQEYLDVLAASRFNRFCLAFGLEYDFPKGVTSDYLHFPYPYLVAVPGYDVRVMQLATADGKPLATPVALSEAERKRNYDALRFIAAQTAMRGLHFQLGIWTHAYQWTDSPHAYHRIEGLTPDNHAPYCRDALAIILKECPEIEGLTLRVHGESGIPEGSYDFWRTLFEAIKGCGRTAEIDMHAKGVDEKMIDIAVKTGMPVKLGAKYSAEHQSLGYQQADIRALEIPKAGQVGEGPFSVSSGARSFTRYGYADFLKAGAPYKLLFRLWPGTQGHLLSADPEMAAAYGRTASFCGAAGLDLMEPLTFKGREGSGQPGGRCAYGDATLNPKNDWEKFELYYRVWGRRLYDPYANAEAWRRWLRVSVGAAALQVETAVANASRILPLLTSAHLPSASNHSFWAELYTNMPTVPGSEPSPYSDTPLPKVFATVSPLDPQLFSAIDEHAMDLLAGNVNPKYSPVEVAQWMEDFAEAANSAIGKARTQAGSQARAAFRRIEADVLIQVGLGRFFAAKLRSGVLIAIFEQTGDEHTGALALDQYRLARETWAAMAAQATVYRADISYGSIAMRRGHWSDRLAAIDRDLEATIDHVRSAQQPGEPSQNTRQAINAAISRPVRPQIECTHLPMVSFIPGAAITIRIDIPQSPDAEALAPAILHYRHVDQAERWKATEMQRDDNGFWASIPAEYTQSPYPLQYYFELRDNNGAAWLHPALNATLSNQPYFAVASRRA
ncbi:MAG: hypothetical protein WBL41_02555 [Terracidiphilus sp.]